MVRGSRWVYLVALDTGISVALDTGISVALDTGISNNKILLFERSENYHVSIKIAKIVLGDYTSNDRTFTVRAKRELPL